MALERYNTFVTLLRIYNESPAYSTEKLLSKYFLGKFDNIRGINIQDVSNECHVSRATVRRFFIKIGFESFLDFKNEFTIPYDISMFKNELNRKEYIVEHINQIDEIQLFFKSNTNNILDNISALARDMYMAKNIYWLTSTSTTRMVEDMQMQFIGLKSVWTIILSKDEMQKVTFTKDDILIVASASAVLADSFISELSYTESPVYLVTLNKEYNNNLYQNIIRLTNETLYTGTKQLSDETIKKEVVSRKYSINLFFDILYYEYAKKAAEC